MLLEKRRLLSTAEKIDKSDVIVQFWIIQENGGLEKVTTTKEKAENDYGLHEPIHNEIFLIESCNSLREIDFSYDSGEIVYHNNDNGFVPREEWKMTMDMEMLNQAFHRKKDFDIPWKPLIGVGMIVMVIIGVTQMGII